MWPEHADCLMLVKETWSKNVMGCHMFILVPKLKLLKAEFKTYH